MTTKSLWKLLTIAELAAIVATILFDLFLPTLVLLGLMLVSLLVRRQHISVMGSNAPSPGS